jgi:hypothetical protein
LVEVYFNIEKINEFINDRVNEIHEENNVKSNVTRLHISKKYEKFALLIYFINYIGYKDIFDKNIINIKDEKIIEFYKKYEKMFRYLFIAKPLDINNLNIKDTIKYINSRLKTVFGISLKKNKKDKNNNYKISGLEIWDKYDDISYNKKEIIDRYEKKLINKKEQKELDKILQEILNSINE